MKGLLFWLLIPTLAFGATQTLIVGTGTNNAAVGDIAFTEVGDITANDANFTGEVAGDRIQDAETHNRLEATMSGNVFTVTGTIDSVRILFDMFDARAKDEGLDHVVRLLTSGTEEGNDQSKAGTVPTTATDRVYAPGDNWGATLTPAIVNATNFGVAYRGKVIPGGGRYEPRIDHIEITIIYTPAAGGADQIFMGITDE